MIYSCWPQSPQPPRICCPATGCSGHTHAHHLSGPVLHWLKPIERVFCQCQRLIPGVDLRPLWKVHLERSLVSLTRRSVTHCPGRERRPILKGGRPGSGCERRGEAQEGSSRQASRAVAAGRERLVRRDGRALGLVVRLEQPSSCWAGSGRKIVQKNGQKAAIRLDRSAAASARMCGLFRTALDSQVGSRRRLPWARPADVRAGGDAAGQQSEGKPVNERHCYNS